MSLGGRAGTKFDPLTHGSMTITTFLWGEITASVGDDDDDGGGVSLSEWSFNESVVLEADLVAFNGGVVHVVSVFFTTPFMTLSLLDN